MRALLAEPGRARERGRHGRERVLAEHTWDRVVDRGREIYRQLDRGDA
jgi:hypothetical protein